MRRLAFIVGIALVTGMIPVASANHFSAGYYDSVGTQPEEAPNDADRSVPGTTAGGETAPDGSASQYEIGTTRSQGCHDPSGQVSDLGETATADGFCGMLVYHEGNTALQQVSEPDQDLPGPIGTFDVTRAQTYFTLGSSCMPFCEQVAGQDNPTGDPLFNATHEAGSTVGLTDPPGTAYEEETDRENNYFSVVHVTSPTNVIQSNTGFWEMNGWWWPAADSTFIAYIYDDQGQPVDETDLQSMVDGMKGTELNPNTEAAVCGYTPDFQFTTVSPDAAGLNCEFEFSYVNTDSQTDPSDPTFDGYDDACETPTYVCGAQNGPAWYSQGCVCLGLTDPKIPGSDPLPGPGSTFAGPEGQTDYIRWHFVVAPHNSQCGGAQEPGFSFSPDGQYSYPYLAHDLDVWTTAASTSLHDSGAAVPELYDWTDAFAERFTTPVGEAIEDPGSKVPLPAERKTAVREPTLEPNNAEPVGGLNDTSRQQVQIQRSLDDACEELFSTETPKTIEGDPWVDYVDSRALALQDVDASGTYATDERIIRQLGLYGSDDTKQDGTNRPGPSFVKTNGKVGVFADKDDDGEYDQLEAGIKYNAQNTLAGGAYPMIWDMWVDQDGQPHPDGGCQANDNKTLSQAANELGYGVHTGLTQAIYLNEPTAFRNAGTTEVVPYPGGNNIYLLQSQAAHKLWTEDLTDGVNPLDKKVDKLVSGLKTYVTSDLGRDEPGVVVPTEDGMSLDSAFADQCSGPTGNFDSQVDFLHDCHTLDCTGDTIATLYTFELTDGQLKGSEALPTFEPTEAGPYDFGSSEQHAWFDIDPFDNDPSRNYESDTPPDPDAGALGEGMSSTLLD